MPVDEEIGRLEHVLAELEKSGVPFSLDTRKKEVARHFASELGYEQMVAVNDVSFGEFGAGDMLQGFSDFRK